MKFVKFEEALNYKNEEKIVGVIFTSKSCPNCSAFMDNMMTKVDKDYQDIEILAVDGDEEEIKFPPPRLPISYWYIPKCDMKIITREGAAPNLESLKFDLDKMVEIHRTGRTFNEVYFGSKE